MEKLNNPEENEFVILRSAQLKRNKKYKVLDFFSMSTKYGKKVVVTVDDNKKYFLPQRYSTIIKKMAKAPEDIDCTGMYMLYEGKMKKNAYNSPILKFVKEEVEESDSDVAEDEEEQEEVEEEEEDDDDEVEQEEEEDDEEEVQQKKKKKKN